jgi:serine/threonine protein kinase
MPPESHKICKIDVGYDVWSMGVLFFATLYGKFPFLAPTCTVQKIYWPIKSYIEIYRPMNILITSMLSYDEQMRPTQGAIQVELWKQMHALNNPNSKSSNNFTAIKPHNP